MVTRADRADRPVEATADAGGLGATDAHPSATHAQQTAPASSVEAVEAASNRLVYAVVLNEDQGYGPTGRDGRWPHRDAVERFLRHRARDRPTGRDVATHEAGHAVVAHPLAWRAAQAEHAGSGPSSVTRAYGEESVRRGAERYY